MEFEKDYNRQEKINLAKKKLKKFRKYHSISPSEGKKSNIQNEEKEERKKLETTIEKQTNFEINSLENTYNKNIISNEQNFNNNMLNTENINVNQDNNVNNNNNNNNKNFISTNNMNINNDINSNNNIINDNKNAIATNYLNINSDTNFSNNIINNNKNAITTNYLNVDNATNFNTNISTIDKVENQNNFNNLDNRSNNNFYQSSTQTVPDIYNNYYPMENESSIINNNYHDTMEQISLDDKKQTETKNSARSVITGFVGSVFKNLLEVAAPPISPEYLNKINLKNNNNIENPENLNTNNFNGLSNTNASINNNISQTNIMYGNEYMNTNVNNNSSLSYSNSSVQNQQSTKILSPPPPMMNFISQEKTENTEFQQQNAKNLENSINSPPLFIQGNNLATLTAQKNRSFSKKKKKWASFSYTANEITVDKDIRNPRNEENTISLKDYMEKQIKNSNINQKTTSETITPTLSMANTTATSLNKQEKIQQQNFTGVATQNIQQPPPPPSFSYSNDTINTTVSSKYPAYQMNTETKFDSNQPSIVINDNEKSKFSAISLLNEKKNINSPTNSLLSEHTQHENISSILKETSTTDSLMIGTSSIINSSTSSFINESTNSSISTSIFPEGSTTSNMPNVEFLDKDMEVSNNFNEIKKSNEGKSIISNIKQPLNDYNEKKKTSIIGIIEENNNVLLSSPLTSFKNMKENSTVQETPKSLQYCSRRESRNSFSSLIRNPDVIELSNSTTMMEENKYYNTDELYDELPDSNVEAKEFDNNNNSNDISINNTPNENMLNIERSKKENTNKNADENELLQNNSQNSPNSSILSGPVSYILARKKKRQISVPMAEVMTSPFGIHTKVIKENESNKMSDCSSIELDTQNINRKGNTMFSENISPDDTTSLFGVNKTNTPNIKNNSPILDDKKTEESLVVDNSNKDISLLFKKNEENILNNNENINKIYNKNNEIINNNDILKDLEISSTLYSNEINKNIKDAKINNINLSINKNTLNTQSSDTSIIQDYSEMKDLDINEINKKDQKTSMDEQSSEINLFDTQQIQQNNQVNEASVNEPVKLINQNDVLLTKQYNEVKTNENVINNIDLQNMNSNNNDENPFKNYFVNENTNNFELTSDINFYTNNINNFDARNNYLENSELIENTEKIQSLDNQFLLETQNNNYINNETNNIFNYNNSTNNDNWFEQFSKESSNEGLTFKSNDQNENEELDKENISNIKENNIISTEYENSQLFNENKNIPTNDYPNQLFETNKMSVNDQIGLFKDNDDAESVLNKKNTLMKEENLKYEQTKSESSSKEEEEIISNENKIPINKATDINLENKNIENKIILSETNEQNEKEKEKEKVVIDNTVEINNSKNDTKEKKYEIDQSGVEIENQLREIESLNMQLNERNQYIHNLNEMIEQIKESKKEKSKEIIENKKTIEHLKSVIEIKDKQIIETNKIKEDNIDEKINNMNNLIQEKINIIKNLNNDIEEYRNKLNENTNNVNILNDTIIGKNNEIKLFSQKVETLTNELNEKIEYQDKLLSQINEIMRKNQVIENEKNENEKLIQMLNENIKEKETNIINLSNEKDMKEMEFKQKLSDFENLYDKLQNTINDLLNKNEECMKKLSILENENEKLMETIKARDNELEKDSNELSHKQEENEFIKKIKLLYPNYTLNDIIKKNENIINNKNLINSPSLQNNMEKFNWTEFGVMNKEDNNNEFSKENNINLFTPQPLIVPMSNEKIHKFEIENNELKQQNDQLNETLKKYLVEIEYLKEIVQNKDQAIVDAPQNLSFSIDNNNQKDLIEIISQLTKDNQSLSRQVQELRHEINENSTKMALPYKYDSLRTSTSLGYTQSFKPFSEPMATSELLANPIIKNGSSSRSIHSIDSRQGIKASTSGIYSGNNYEPTDLSINNQDYSYGQRKLSNYSSASLRNNISNPHMQLLNQLEEREKNERNKMFSTTNTDLHYMQQYQYPNTYSFDY